MKRILAISLAALAVICSVQAPVAFAQAYPSKPIRLVVPSPPGIVTDIAARLVAQKLRDRLGWNVVVENKPGGNYVIGIQAVLSAPADGYTLLLGVSSMALIPLTAQNLPFDIGKDLAPVTRLVSLQNVLFAGPSAPYSTFEELVDYAKKHPGTLSYGTVGSGTLTHLGVEHLKQTVGIDVIHVPYKGETLIGDVMSGVTSLAILPPFNVASYASTGKVKPIVLLGSSRSPLMPNVRTTADIGLPDVKADGWLAIMVKSGTPATIIDTLNKEIVEVVNLPDVKTQFLGMGLVPLGDRADQFAKAYAEDLTRFSKSVQGVQKLN